MKLNISENKLAERPEQFIRRAGYGMVRYRHEHQPSWARRLGNGHYPRFHVYISQQDENITFDLHLDQKEASYKGSRMHSGEYDGETVANEIARLRSMITSIDNDKNASSNKTKPLDRDTGRVSLQTDPLSRMKKGVYSINAEQPKSKSWWKRIFS